MLVLLAFAQLTFAKDFVKQLTPKDFTRTLPPLVKGLGEHEKCAIPLKEIRVEYPDRLDPMARPDSRNRVDKGIIHPVPMKVCDSR
jgi:hypothetical protein